MNDNLKNFALATHNELFDTDHQGGEWTVEAVETRETLEQFNESSANWSERGEMKTGEIAGFKFIAWGRIQACKGQPRQALSVVDLGDVRIALPGTNFDHFC